jgi:hypothetical protein
MTEKIGISGYNYRAVHSEKPEVNPEHDRFLTG